jgi:SIR2-like domain
LQIQPVERLKSLFLQQNLASPIILLGAGASLKSGIPLSEQVVEIAARWAYCHSQGFHPDDPSIKRSDWLRWLHAHNWYERSSNTEDNYSTVLENLLQPRENRKEFFLRLLNPNVPASTGYDHLLEVLDTGRVQTVLTTNFDRVLPNLHVMRRRPHYLEEIRTPADYTKFSTSPPHPQFVYLHGSVEHYNDKNLVEEVQRLDGKLVQLLAPLLRDHPLIVVGYRGAEPSIMHHLLLDQCGTTNNYRQGIYWCTLSDSYDHLHPLAQELATRITSNFQIVGLKALTKQCPSSRMRVRRCPPSLHCKEQRWRTTHPFPLICKFFPRLSSKSLIGDEYKLSSPRIAAECKLPLQDFYLENGSSTKWRNWIC